MTTTPNGKATRVRRRGKAVGTATLAIALAALVASAAPAAAAVTTYNVSGDSAHCATADAKITFGTKLKSGGSSATTLKLAGHADSCLDASNALVKRFKGTATGTGSAATNDCASWFGGGLLDTALTGTARMVWTPATGQKFSPTVLVGTAQKAVTDWALEHFLTRPTNPVTETPDTYYFGVIKGTPSGDFVSATPAGFGEYIREDAGLLFAQCAGTGIKTVNMQVGYFVSGA